MALLKGLIGGVVGATSLTLLHETARRVLPDAPRADLLGMRALAAVLDTADAPVPEAKRLHRWALVGDMVGNSLYYSFAGGSATHPWRRGALLGLLAGVGAVALPGPLGLGRETTSRTPATGAMTVLWYLAGGLAAAAAARLLRGDSAR